MIFYFLLQAPDRNQRGESRCVAFLTARRSDRAAFEHGEAKRNAPYYNIIKCCPAVVVGRPHRRESQVICEPKTYVAVRINMRTCQM